jgi:hypothetical protein
MRTLLRKDLRSLASGRFERRFAKAGQAFPQLLFEVFHRFGGRFPMQRNAQEGFEWIGF